jgi:hypothetical protein
MDIAISPRKEGALPVTTRGMDKGIPGTRDHQRWPNAVQKCLPPRFKNHCRERSVRFSVSGHFKVAAYTLPHGSLPSPLHAGLCCRRHDFAARIVGFLGRSGFSGNVFGVICGCGVQSVDRVKVCGIRTLLPGSPGLVDPPDFGAPSWQHCSLSLPRSIRRSGIPIRTDGTRRWRAGSGTSRRRRPYPYNCAATRL